MAARRALRLRPRIETAVPETAMVMAAGLGTRMRPLTATRPKPLIEVNGKALIDHVFDRLRAAGVAKAVVNVHYLPEALEAHLQAHADGLDIRVSDERDLLLETGGGMVRAAPMIGSDPFFSINSDNYWVDGPSDTLRLLASHWDEEAMDALLLVVPHARPAVDQLQLRVERRPASGVADVVRVPRADQHAGDLRLAKINSPRDQPLGWRQCRDCRIRGRDDLLMSPLLGQRPQFRHGCRTALAG